MNYRRGNTKLSGDIGGVLNKDNAEKTLAMQDITKIADNEEMPRGNNDLNSPFSGTIAVPVQNPKTKNDFGLMQAQYSGVSKKLLPFVKSAVESNIYEGSPVLRDIGPDRASLDKIINEVLDSACRCFDEAEEICLESCRESWNESQLLYNLTESLVLSEIFLNKRTERCEK